ncbi:MAG: DUF6807 family protein, partial [Verrucomicrobiota bacterium]
MNALSRLLFLLPAFLTASPYVIDTISFPEDVPVEVGALDFAENGDLYVALRRGDIFVATPQEAPDQFAWRHFASGFHNACGIHIVAPGHLIIGQMAELTEVKDTDKDGIADLYQALSTEFGLSGNYHETMDICSDGNGGLYLAPGTASHNGPTFTTPRGNFADAGRFGRNYASVTWRGWVLHWHPETGITPFSSGYRMHNGIERDPQTGHVWCGDNQGDWRSSSPVYHVREDSFSGHPSSLVWDPRFAGIENPLLLPRRLLDDLWNKPAFRLPRSMMNSCAEPAFLPESFGPFAGQMLIPDQSGDRIVRLMPEMVDGAYQGAATMLIEGEPLHRGNNRLAFDRHGTLYVGQTGRGWGKLSEGLQRVRPTGDFGFEVITCQLSNSGFQLTFTEPLVKATNLRLTRYRYNYGYSYGGDELETKVVTPESVEIDSDQPTILHLTLPEGDLLSDHIYRFDLSGVSSDSKSYRGKLTYTLNRLLRPKAEHQITLTASGDDRYRVEINGDLFTEVRTKGFSNPILYPIHGPSGLAMTRDWPVREDGRPNEQQDHPHHKSLFLGHQGINGTNFWHENREESGIIEHARTIETRSGEDRALLRTFNLWKDSEGTVICTDTRELTFGLTDQGARYIDLELNLHASHGPVTLEEWKDGFL